MKFYDLAGSPNTRRVRIFLAEKGLDIPTVMVDMMKGENLGKRLVRVGEDPTL